MSESFQSLLEKQFIMRSRQRKAAKVVLRSLKDRASTKDEKPLNTQQCTTEVGGKTGNSVNGDLDQFRSSHCSVLAVACATRRMNVFERGLTSMQPISSLPLHVSLYF